MGNERVNQPPAAFQPDTVYVPLNTASAKYCILVVSATRDSITFRVMTPTGWSAFSITVPVEPTTQTACILINFEMCKVQPSTCYQTAHDPASRYPLVVQGMLKLNTLRRHLSATRIEPGRLNVMDAEWAACKAAVAEVRVGYNELCSACLLHALCSGLHTFWHAIVDFAKPLKEAEVAVKESANDKQCIEEIKHWFKTYFIDLDDGSKARQPGRVLDNRSFQVPGKGGLTAPTIVTNPDVLPASGISATITDPITDMVYTTLLTCSSANIAQLNTRPTIVQKFAYLLEVFDKGRVDFGDILIKNFQRNFVKSII